MSLDRYNDKRKFDSTPEPAGNLGTTKGNRFVVQRHDARKLHYDLRLEMDGVLKSWAVPKGPSLNPEHKRLAIHTEDHPVEYLSFEGTIPKGNYGAGDMEIWDHGTFEILPDNDPDQQLQQLARGDLKIRFTGKKLRGAFALVKMKGRNNDKQWLLIKKKDQFAIELPDNTGFPEEETDTSKEVKVKKLSTGTFVPPMLASQPKKIFNDPEWIYEIKWDGYRIIASIEHGKVELYSRNGNPYGKLYPKIKKSLEGLQHDVILDGEIVIVNAEGIPNFQALQNYDPVTTPGELRYYVFDMLYLNGHEMLNLPLLDRKSLIPEVIEDLDCIFYCDHVEGMGQAFYTRAIEAGLEGVIAKKKDSLYTPGHRSENWIKVKAIQTEDVLICGYTDSQNGGSIFGSLILGKMEEGALVYIGNCGSGYSNSEQKKLREKFELLAKETTPFDQKINLKGRKPNWLNPQLICKVKFSEYTSNGIMRHPIYKGLLAENKQNEETASVQDLVGGKSRKNTQKSDSGNVLELDGIQLPLTHLDKVYWPETGLRKYDLIDYYLNIAETILPYLVDRPQNMHRHPEGIRSEGFYQKDNENLPKWAKTVILESKSAKKDIEYLVCQNEATLLYMANLGCIELNPWSSRIGSLEHPDYTVIDLDPSQKNSFEEVIETAQCIKDILDKAKIPGFCKTSGSRGLHIYIPLAGNYSYSEARDFTKLICYFVQQRLPKLTTLERTIKKRNGRIYLDCMQNRKAQTLAAAYCVRPKPQAPVSAPLLWKEVKSGLRIADFTLSNMQERIAEHGDLFKAVLEEGIDMEACLNALDKLD
ncbi:DNA ligase D [Flavimarina sp. Hel_I_48]|uniref:DNA ligase D n=1 Tax=Flavimarina sp. Hel_I_48 TaxID=1392488 RepID=UPI0004DF69AB|nr:DNA ligase D [Flavimarina sp. Hel_I_48]